MEPMPIIFVNVKRNSCVKSIILVTVSPGLCVLNTQVLGGATAIVCSQGKREIPGSVDSHIMNVILQIFLVITLYWFFN